MKEWKHTIHADCDLVSMIRGQNIPLTRTRRSIDEAMY